MQATTLELLITIVELYYKIDHWLTSGAEMFESPKLMHDAADADEEDLK